MSNNKALIIIDVQNDYFPGGVVPLWNANGALQSILNVVKKAKQANIPIILVQHISPENSGADLFIKDTYGAEIHPELLKAVPDATIVTKTRADSFRKTNLNEVVDKLGATELLICGMQTSNCVGLTAISEFAKQYKVSVLADCCTAEAQHVHLFALAGFGDIVPMVQSTEVLN
ncbi:cysteine hydrolase family protein [Entomomonas asaccharolytica]|uniref:Isochorismatase family protein n=1 Tax=Entomomonas asaccharolytica TaxID=2785331 RepID=A0A974RW27_9GAMM|nr:isochorismatase family protein [Entomomonas asaccharolytica]QQP84755.1 isochorismatase family protein [Entomomonas asaccharolytica]